MIRQQRLMSAICVNAREGKRERRRHVIRHDLYDVFRYDNGSL